MGSSFRNPTVFLSFFFLLSHYFHMLSHATDTIKKGQFIRDGETIVSSGETFALGFFSPSNSSLRYVGIWYNKLPLQTVVWIANRENPIRNSSGILTIASDGDLKVLDGRWKTLWSTNTSTWSSNATVVLMDTGNLLLYGEDNDDPDTALWQSFDYPTDTFLPGMRAGLNTTGDDHRYTSWKSDSDPSKGNFTMGVDPDGLAQIVIWNNSRRYWRSGLWNGQVFIGIPEMKVRYLYGFKLSDQGGKMYFTYTASDASDLIRFQVRWDGTVEESMWDEEKREWNNVWIEPTNKCQVHNECGAFATCNMLNSPICTCLRGFEPKSMIEWNRHNWSNRCVRRSELQCEKHANGIAAKGDRFLELNGVKLPDHSDWKADLSNNQCEDNCVSNCSCLGYAHVSGIGCLTWDRDLVDIQKFQQGGSRLYLRLANSEFGMKKTVSTWVIVLCVVIILVVLGIIFLSTFAYLQSRRKAKIKDMSKKGNCQAIALGGNKSRKVWKDFTEKHLDGEQIEENLPELLLLTFDSMVISTNNFSDANKLGEGGFGPVYKGIVPCGREVAVKRLSRKSTQGIEEFKNEVTLIAKLQHRNLVKILACCIEGEEKMLVYEYLPNKSLDAFIFDSTMKVRLDWRKRFNIIGGIARGLLYLHRDSRLTIIHRDLKASNILLDEEMNPKISDFGMAKIFAGNDQESTNRLVGTYGYMAPEYAMEGSFSIKSDVYSFGVLLLEIISCKKNRQNRQADPPFTLIGHVWMLWKEERALDFLDSSIRDSCSQSEALRCIQVGLLCLQDMPMDRPSMSSVVSMLENEDIVLPTPKQPTFIQGRSPRDSDMSIDSSEITSINDVTVTMILGR